MKALYKHQSHLPKQKELFEKMFDSEEDETETETKIKTETSDETMERVYYPDENV